MIKCLAMQFILSSPERRHIQTNTKALIFVCSFRSAYACNKVISHMYPEITVLLKNYNTTNVDANSSLFYALKCLEIEIERLNAPRRTRNQTESSSVFVEPEPAVVSPGMHVVDGKMLLLAEDRKKPKEKEGIFKRLRKFTYRGFG